MNTILSQSAQRAQRSDVHENGGTPSTRSRPPNRAGCVWILPAGGRGGRRFKSCLPDRDCPASDKGRFGGASRRGLWVMRACTPISSPASPYPASRGGLRPATASFLAGRSQVRICRPDRAGSATSPDLPAAGGRRRHNGVTSRSSSTTSCGVAATRPCGSPSMSRTCPPASVTSRRPAAQSQRFTPRSQ